MCFNKKDKSDANNPAYRQWSGQTGPTTLGTGAPNPNNAPAANPDGTQTAAPTATSSPLDPLGQSQLGR